jgi:hypothetical protein
MIFLCRSNWIRRVSNENEHKETRGLYRKMLLEVGVFKSPDEADAACKVRVHAACGHVLCV